MSQPVTPQHVEWAYRLLLDREAEEGIAARFASQVRDVRALRETIFRSTEYALKNNTSTGIGDAVVIALLDSYGVRGRLFINLSDLIGVSVARGEYEREEIAFVKNHLEAGQTFIDIGGNIGFFTVVASSIVGGSGRVITIEALPANVASIHASINENEFCTNVSVINAIVGKSRRSDMFIAHLPLEEGSGNSGGSYIVTADDPIPANLRRDPIRQETLDDLVLAELGEGHIDFIKIDIEGAEALAMLGAKRALSEHAPIILSEVHTDQLFKISKRTWREYFELMQSFGFRPHFFNGGVLAGEPSVLESGKVYNVAFVKAAP